MGYPDDIDTFPPYEDRDLPQGKQGSLIDLAMIELIQNAIIITQTILGTNPQGVDPTVRVRIENIEAEKANLSGFNMSGDINMTVNSIYGVQYLGIVSNGVLFLDNGFSKGIWYESTGDLIIIFGNAKFDDNLTVSGNQNIFGNLIMGNTNILGVDVFHGRTLSVEEDIQIRETKTPASSGATGLKGTITWDADYIYVCVATDTWKRVAISTW